MSADEAAGAGAGEVPDDPVSAAPNEEVVLAAKADASGKGRWHLKGADKVAVQLQIGRGRSKADVAKEFKVGLSTLSHWVRDEKWSSRLNETRRRALSWRVMLAGHFRRCKGEDIDLDRLKETAAWRTLPAAQQHGEQEQFQMDISDDDYDTEADPKRDTRNYFRRRLDEIIAELNSGPGRGAEPAQPGAVGGDLGRSEDTGGA